jgi:hypothetical protein
LARDTDLRRPTPIDGSPEDRRPIYAAPHQSAEPGAVPPRSSTPHFDRIAGAPTDEQAALVQSLASLEWFSLVAESEGGLQGYREAREHRRLFQKLFADFERTLHAAAPSGSLAEVTERIIAARSAASEAPA